MAEIFFAPFAHGEDDGNNAFPERGEAVFCFGRDDRVQFAVNNAVLLHLAQLHGEHFSRCLRELALEFAEAHDAGIIEVPNDERLVLACNDSLCRFQRAMKLCKFIFPHEKIVFERAEKSSAMRSYLTFFFHSKYDFI